MTNILASQQNDISLDAERMPVHVAIIMDGNGRWANSRGKSRLSGHNQGYRTLKQIVYASQVLGIRYLTVYGFSTENWRRPMDEVGGLMRLMLKAMRSEIEELIAHNIRVRVVGRLEYLPQDLRLEFERAMDRTSSCSSLTFTIAINYGGRAEVVDAVRRITQQVKDGLIDPDTVNEQTISANLYAPDIPDPDLLIRTAGEWRLSNFLLWETAYSELFVTPICWPDFDKTQLINAIFSYQQRVRKFGAVMEKSK